MKKVNKKQCIAICLCLLSLMAHAEKEVSSPKPCEPVPTELQMQWQEMEEYAFLHFSLNTFTNEEWGYGDESPKIFNPKKLDARQWARTCKAAGMKGIILTAKHHCGFCLWPSAYTDYSVKNSPWKDGKGDIVRELADACKEYGLKFGVYLSPWDRHQASYATKDYITYYRNQLRELSTNYGDLFEVWFDGANGGDGYYGGAREKRSIDRKTYYEWQETYRMIRLLQPHCLIWNDGGDRGDLRWIGTEKGFAGETNWSLLYKTGDVPIVMLQHGVENGNVWVPGEVDVSIRPGWFYHQSEDDKVKSVSELMDIYYKSVGRNSTLLLNFPIDTDGLINPIDSARGVEFANTVRSVFKDNLAKNAKLTASNVRGKSKIYSANNVIDGNKQTYWATDDSVKTPTLIINLREPKTFNRFVIGEYIRLGQRVREFSLEVWQNGKWMPIKDELCSNDGLTTIGYKRIICFHTITAQKLRLRILSSKACPLIKEIGLYYTQE